MMLYGSHCHQHTLLTGLVVGVPSTPQSFSVNDICKIRLFIINNMLLYHTLKWTSISWETNNVIKSLAYIFSLSLQNTAQGKNLYKTFILYLVFKSSDTIHQFLELDILLMEIGMIQIKYPCYGHNNWHINQLQSSIDIKSALLSYKAKPRLCEVLYINRVNIANPWLHLIH